MKRQSYRRSVRSRSKPSRKWVYTSASKSQLPSPAICMG
jgi:hypothetical protein